MAWLSNDENSKPIAIKGEKTIMMLINIKPNNFLN